MKRLSLVSALSGSMVFSSVSADVIFKDIFSDVDCVSMPFEEASQYREDEMGDLIWNERTDRLNSIDRGNWLTDNDEGNFNLMGHIEMEYSLPHSLKVCADSFRIYGLQLTLYMRRVPFEREDEIVEKYGEQEFIEALDNMIESSVPRRMSFIGSFGEGEVGVECTTTRFFDAETTLDSIDVYTDLLGVRTLELVMNHNLKTESAQKIVSFGAQ